MNKELFEEAFNEESFEGGYVPTSYHLFDVTDSTNEEIIKRAEAGAPEGTLAVSLKQTNGQGRSGRSFFSPDAGNLYMSFLLRPLSSTRMELLTPAAAVATIRGIKKVCNVSPQIKWVNDIYLSDKKISGIIARAQNVQDAARMYVCIGIGINVHVPNEEIPSDIPSYGTIFDHVELEGEENIIPKLCASIYSEYMKIYTDMDDLDFMREYKNASNCIGKEVTYISGNDEKTIFVEDISDDGALIVRDEEGALKSFRDGEIRIKL